MDTQTLRTDAYLIASVVCGALSLIGIQFSVASVASLIIAIGGALMIIIPAVLAAWREIHHLNLKSAQAASASLALAAIPAPPASDAPAAPSYTAVGPGTIAQVPPAAPGTSSAVASDAPTLVAPVVVAAPPASAQVVTDAT